MAPTTVRGQNLPAFPRRLGGQLPLDFVNTIEPRTGPDRPVDVLTGYPELVRWGAYAGILPESRVPELLTEDGRHPADATRVLVRALALREACYRIFRALAHQEAPAAPDLAVLHDDYVTALAHTTITATGAGVELQWREEPGALDRVLWPIARSAVELLLTGDPARIKECAGPAGDCGWLFYDASKNASRRWCSMEGCGSQAKMRRHRLRARTTSPPAR